MDIRRPLFEESSPVFLVSAHGNRIRLGRLGVVVEVSKQGATGGVEQVISLEGLRQLVNIG